MATTKDTVTVESTTMISGVTQDPWKPGRHNARLTDGPRIWLIIATLRRLNGSVQKTAAEWVIPESSVEIAIDYYRQHRDLIDAQILLTNEEDEA